MEMTINITEGINDYEFYNVPEKVAKAIITLLHECEKDDSTIISAISEQKINELPSVTPQEPKTGHWITKPHIYGVTYCSECDFELKIDNTNYCPNCGCRMVEPQESEG